jgi:arylsulfate sulfotransferase
MHWETVNPSGKILHVGTDFPFTTGLLPENISFPATQVLIPAMGPTSASAPVLLHDYLPRAGAYPTVPAATDLSGNILWYYPLSVSLLPRTEVGGNAFIIDIKRGLTPYPYQQILREIDLAGNTVLETNVARINEQLLALGRRPINQFHHEARRLPNGYIAVLGSDEMLVYDAQGGTQQDPVDVLGAQVIVLDQNLQLRWAWDAYDFLDITRVANLNEQCTAGVGTGCPVFFLLPTANDWLHANSIQQTSDGNLLVSIRHQDWVIKINYAKGKGDGHVMWRMGYQGDFTMLNPPTSPNCTTPDQQDAYQWFTHQHDVNFQYGGNTVLSAFDNGNLRVALCDTNGNSRGYVLSIDEAHRQATPILVSDLGSYSVALGAAELIAGGPNYHFELGQIVPGVYGTSVEIDPGGVIDFAMQELDVLIYRSFRMQDLYTPALQ